MIAFCVCNELRYGQNRRFSQEMVQSAGTSSASALALQQVDGLGEVGGADEFG